MWGPGVIGEIFYAIGNGNFHVLGDQVARWPQCMYPAACFILRGLLSVCDVVFMGSRFANSCSILELSKPT